MKKVLFAFSSFVIATTAASAADIQAIDETAPVSAWFGYVEGAYAFRTSSHNRQYDSADSFEARTGGGGSGAARLGYRLADSWDVAAGFRYLEQSTGRRNDDRFDWQFTGGRYWNLDVEAGYRAQHDDWSLRPFAGLRYQTYSADFTDNVSPFYYASSRSWGIGPRIGFDVSRPVAEQLSFFASADASVLFGKIEAERKYSGYAEFSDSRTFGTVGAKAGLAWEFAPGVELGGGYQLEYLSAVGYKTFQDAPLEPSGRASQLIHGPFMRLSLNY
ncbi:Lpg1974 family pore-forming outer membrane protein [Aminobacter aganoensis]|uniref:Opacity protein-like surface antigen n=1 Tax=Aminobacter aganoensis TaxID=83264 RepID=A0A7X0KMP4_9HYPH|nr:Lpg1974 family pore-forming outer membrane protein [Aminobacter aganoensis]MBB6356352.1 opacity protein-like surface antigen [Aminobacter aganoensis]